MESLWGFEDEDNFFTLFRVDQYILLGSDFDKVLQLHILQLRLQIERDVDSLLWLVDEEHWASTNLSDSVDTKIDVLIFALIQLQF